jgi:hypothetical protein
MGGGHHAAHADYYSGNIFFHYGTQFCAKYRPNPIHFPAEAARSTPEYALSSFSNSLVLLLVWPNYSARFVCVTGSF